MNGAGLMCVACVGALLVAEVGRAPRLRIVAKSGAAVAMVLCAALAGAGGSAAGRRILVGLSLSAVGDACLLSSATVAFMAGLLAFAAAHGAYGAAAVTLGASWLLALLVAAALWLPSRAIWRWLSPHVPSGLRLAVLGYMAVITAMVALAVSACLAGTASPRFALGALLFYASDLAVARERFVAGSVVNKLWGLPAYFGGQLLLATSV